MGLTVATQRRFNNTQVKLIRVGQIITMEGEEQREEGWCKTNAGGENFQNKTRKRQTKNNYTNNKHRKLKQNLKTKQEITLKPINCSIHEEDSALATRLIAFWNMRQHFHGLRQPKGPSFHFDSCSRHKRPASPRQASFHYDSLQPVPPLSWFTGGHWLLSHPVH